MKLYIVFLLLCSTASAAVGEVTTSSSVSDTSTVDSLAGTTTEVYGQSTGYQMLDTTGSSPASSTGQWYSSGSEQVSGSQYTSQGPYSAPQASGPVQEKMTADDLGLSIPQMESFSPDENLGFVSASPSVTSVSTGWTGTAVSGSAQQSGSAYGSALGSSQVQQSGYFGLQSSYNWYYPGQVSSTNRFYIETASGFKTAAGCSLYGYLPIWSDIKSSGYFFVYEWYPGSSSPLVSSWGWTAAGWKKGWFYADRPGWHTLCYNSGFWSNYIYIYVYPVSYGSTGTLPSGAPVPPNPGSENIVMPDYSQYRPATATVSSAYSTATAAAQSTTAMGTTTGTGSLSPATANPALAGTYSGIAGGSMSSATTTTASSITYTQASGSAQPVGYAPQSYHAVYPLPSVCKCNEYYVQDCTGKLGTVAGVFCGEWLPLWSKINRAGQYWSYEWTPCGGESSTCWMPEASSFGFKTYGWHQTWFKGDKPGWHILSYHCSDWSNYIYIYVWPEE